MRMNVKVVAGLGLLCALVAPIMALWALFWPTLGANMVWDDKFLLAHQNYLRMGFSWQAILSPVINNPAHWRPLGMLFIAPHFDLLSKIAGVHIAQLAWMSGLCALVTLAAWRLLGVAVPQITSEQRAVGAALPALALAMMPGASQAAYWISHRFGLVGGCFLLLTLLLSALLFARGRDNSGRFVFALGALLAGLASEAMWGWMFAVLGLGLSWGWPTRLRPWAWALGGAAALYAFARLALIGRLFPEGYWDEFSISGAASDLAYAVWAQCAPWFDAIPGTQVAWEAGSVSAALACAGLTLWAAALTWGIRRWRGGDKFGAIWVGWAVATLIVVLSSRPGAASGISGVLGGDYVVGSALLALAALQSIARILAAKTNASKPQTAGLIALTLVVVLGFGANASRQAAHTWSSDALLWTQAVEHHPGSALATVNAMVSLTKSGESSRAMALGEAYWNLIREKKSYTRPEAAALATYISILQQGNELDQAAIVATIALPKAPSEPLLAVNAASVFLARENWSDALNAANFSLLQWNRTWRGRRMAAALHEAAGRAELGLGRASVAEERLIESRRLMGIEPKKGDRTNPGTNPAVSPDAAPAAAAAAAAAASAPIMSAPKASVLKPTESTAPKGVSGVKPPGG